MAQGLLITGPERRRSWRSDMLHRINDPPIARLDELWPRDWKTPQDQGQDVTVTLSQSRRDRCDHHFNSRDSRYSMFVSKVGLVLGTIFIERFFASRLIRL